MQKTLKYSLTEAEVRFILQALNRTQLVGVDTAQALVNVVEKMQKPENADELDKEVYENLKTRFEKKEEKK
jgi:hypothetical protein